MNGQPPSTSVARAPAGETLPGTTSSAPNWRTRWARLAVERRLRDFPEAIEVREDGAGRTLGRSSTQATEPPPRLHVHRPSFWPRIVSGGDLGAAESYALGEWSSPDLPRLLRLFARHAEAADRLGGGSAFLQRLVERFRHRRRANTLEGARRNIQAHYDLGNDFFELFLDPTMTYSAAWFENPDAELGEAQRAKLDRACGALELGPDDHLLEIGTGWGSMAIHAASTYGCRVTTTTISDNQFALARQRVKEALLEDRIEVVRKDYRDLAREAREAGHTFDKLVSIEMIEAVGHEHLPAYFGACASLLAPGGRMLLQAISMPEHRYERYLENVDFIRAFIFPGSCCPSVGAILGAAAPSGLTEVDRFDLTPHYAETLRRWRRRLASRTDEARDRGYGDRLLRLWDYYFAYCEAGFDEGYISDAQILFERNHR